MRFIVFCLGILGSLLVGFFGWFWLDYASNREIAQMARDQGVDMTLVMPDYDIAFEATTRAAVFLLLGAALGILGSLFALMRRGRQGAVLMILAILGPAILNPVTLIFTNLLAFAGLLSLLVRPLPLETDALS